MRRVNTHVAYITRGVVSSKLPGLVLNKKKVVKTVVLAVSVAALAFCALGCKKKSSPPVKTYQARGLVQHVPDKGPPALVVRHEAIDFFIHSDGVPAGMHSMTMTLRLDDAVSAKDVKVGDKIAFDLNVNWDRTPPLLIMKLRKLPAKTELVYGKSKGRNK